MRKILALALTAVLLFGISAGLSWYLRRLREPHEEQAANTTEKTGRSLPGGGGLDGSVGGAPKAGGRVPYSPDAEGTVTLAANLRERLEAVRAREQQLGIRQKHLELIYQDIRGERGAIDGLRRQLGDEMKALREKLGDLDRKAAELDVKREAGAEQVREIKKTMTEYEGTETDRVKQMAAVYDAMAPENAAKILQQMADTGNTETAVKVLSAMKERQAARVLAELSDPAVAAQLLEKMKGLKKPSTTKKKPGE